MPGKREGEDMLLVIRAGMDIHENERMGNFAGHRCERDGVAWIEMICPQSNKLCEPRIYRPRASAVKRHSIRCQKIHMAMTSSRHCFCRPRLASYTALLLHELRHHLSEP
jgi:hypothetical protein